ncbi:GNAT family N-acetyltransferase [Actinomadura rupiterrae]|uniref:GNAT family N-acetyltransferase n=1 Tax=Actinomadura rupiterrae TaxID=559627 RepID=UPI0020A460EE|nr:GNAT family N-acetyltransferase [Actinomadura rupiterrae]MCP2335165.1 CelD/BcsL family acetyltransferase involved in cellulose biosynthesis [Actinomadura rupiterrae]
MSPYPSPHRVDEARWHVQIHHDDTAWDALHADWNELYERSGATPFQSLDWNIAWWRHYGRPGRLRLVTVRRDGRLVALAPLTLCRQYGHRVLMPLAAAQSDHTDVLIDREHAAIAADRLAGALLAEPGWSVLDFPEVMPNGAVGLLAERWTRLRRREPSSVCLQLPACAPGEFAARFPRRTAGKVRARLRKIEALGLEIRQVAATESERAIGEMLHLHERQWQGRGINTEHLQPRFAAMLADAAASMIPSGRAVLTEYRRDDRVVASDLVVVGADWVGAYLYGAEPDLRNAMDVSLMLLSNDLRLASGLGRQSLSLLRGQEDYKLKWQPTLVQNERVVLCRSALAASYLACVTGRGRLARLVHSARSWRARATGSAPPAAPAPARQPEPTTQPARPEPAAPSARSEPATPGTRDTTAAASEPGKPDAGTEDTAPAGRKEPGAPGVGPRLLRPTDVERA